jgi:SAM-dependent methyltransferase
VPTSINFDRMASRYDDTRGGEERGRWVAEHIAPHLPSGQLLEIGVGTGLIAKAFAERGWTVTGVDLSEAMLELAARRVPGRVARADAQALPLRDRSVDACVAVHVFHLVGDSPAVFAEVARVLRPGGRLAVVGTGESGAQSSDITAVLRPMNVGLRGADHRRDHPDVLVPLAAEAGLRVVEDVNVVRETRSPTPNAVIAQIRTKVWSSLWDLTDQQWTTHVEPALAALRELPDPDRPRPGRTTTRSVVFATDSAQPRVERDPAIANRPK